MKAIIALLAILFVQLSLAQDEVKVDDAKRVEKEVRVDQETHRMRLYFRTDFTNIPSPASDGTPLSAFGLTITGLYAFSDKIAAGFSAWQSFTLTGSSVITSFDGRLVYALTGKLTSTDEQTTIDNTRVISVKDYDTSGFRAELLAVQYYFNASANTVPYNGFGFGGYYEFVNQARTSFIVGGRYDMISNSDYSTSPMQFFVGVGTPF